MKEQGVCSASGLAEIAGGAIVGEDVGNLAPQHATDAVHSMQPERVIHAARSAHATWDMQLVAQDARSRDCKATRECSMECSMECSVEMFG